MSTTSAIENPSRYRMKVTDPRNTVIPYDPGWPQLFRSLARRIAPALRGLDATIEHVGSTAVPGLAAKPIVDMDVVVGAPELTPAAVGRLEGLGYVHQGDGGIVGRESFAPPAGWDYHHLYLVVAGNEPHRDHIDLRDYLRSHPAELERYAAVKLAAAPLLSPDRPAYFAAKDPLIRELLHRARSGRLA
jgi:GrpB-like predicted nucleotidyltransferase (UPF0157 family)